MKEQDVTNRWLKVPWWVLRSGLSPQERAVLQEILLCAGGKDRAWPSIRKTAYWCCLSKNTVTAVIKSLEERGLITARRRPGARTIYSVTPPTEVVIVPNKRHTFGHKNQSLSPDTNRPKVDNSITKPPNKPNRTPFWDACPKVDNSNCPNGERADQPPEPRDVSLLDSVKNRNNKTDRARKRKGRAKESVCLAAARSSPVRGLQKEARKEDRSKDKPPSQLPIFSEVWKYCAADAPAGLGLSGKDAERCAAHYVGLWFENGFASEGNPIRNWRALLAKAKTNGWLPTQKLAKDRAKAEERNRLKERERFKI
jgi:Helix-turn-helix domain